jgi:hypothetical protein
VQGGKNQSQFKRKDYPMITLTSALGPIEHIRRGNVIRANYDPQWDEFVLTATTRSGNGRQVPLPSWTELYRENKSLATEALFRLGAQLSIKSLDLVLQ